MRTPLLCTAGALLIPLAAASAEERRELDAHEHGHGSFNMAVEGKTVAVELRVPGADIVGFEYEAKSAKDKAALKTAKESLSAPLALFKMPAAAGCKVSSAKAEFVLDDDRDDHGDHKEHAEHKGEKHSDDHHDHDKHAEHKREKHADHHDDHDKHAEAKKAEHAEFHADYQLTCAAPEKLTSIDFAYFSKFKNAEELEVKVVTAKGQSQYEVTRAKPKLDLGGTI